MLHNHLPPPRAIWYSMARLIRTAVFSPLAVQHNVTFNGQISGSNDFDQSSTGTTTLAAVNTFTGTVRVSSGTLQETVAGGLPDGNSYVISGGALMTNNNDLTMSQLNGSSGANVNLGTGTLTIDMPLSVNTYSGNITAGAITISGTGTQILAGNNNYGDTTIDAGATLQIGNSGTTGNLGSGNISNNGQLVFDRNTSLTVVGNISGTGTLEAQGVGSTVLTGTNTYSGTTTIDAGSLLQIGDAGTTGTLGTGNVADDGTLAFNRSDTIIVDNTISGAGTVEQIGTGTVILTSTGAPNTYSGGTTINAGGTLQMGNADTTGTIGTGNVTDNGTLAFDRSDASPVTVSNNISGSGGIHQLGSATIVLTGTNGYSGTTLIDAGTSLDVGGGGTSGTLGTGTATDDGTLILDRSDALTVSAAIQGLGAVHQVGAGTATLTGANSYSGTTTIDAGTTLQIGASGATGTLGAGAVTNSGTLAFDRSDALSVSNTISGSGVLNQIGSGTTTISGVVSQSSTNVNAGQLNIDSASFNSPVNVMSNGTLGGIGSLTGNVSNSGTVAPGNTATPLGTLTVNGSYTHNSNATIQATIDSSGNSSLLNATGTATLNGGTVNVVSTTGSANAGTKYMFLTAGSVSGTFANATTENLPSALVPVLGYTSNTAFFTLLRNGETYEAAGRTFNQRAVGRYLDEVSPTATGDLQTVFNSLNSLSDDADLRAAEDQLGGAVHGTLAQIGVNNTSLVIGQLAQRLRSSSFTPCCDPEPICCRNGDGCCCPALCNGGSLAEGLFAPIPSAADGTPWTGWAQGFGLGGSAKADNNADGIKYDAGGAIAGMERWIDDSRLLGFYGGYVGTGANNRGPNDSINGGNFGGYLYTDDGFNYYTVAAGFEFDSYTTHRAIIFADIDREASANYDGWQAYTYLERGVSFESANTVFQPFAALQYIYLRQNSFTENGADSIDLTTGGIDTNSLRSLLGARLQYAIWQRNGRRSMPEVHAYWMHEYLNSHTLLDATFSPVPTGGATPFGVHGLDMGRDWAVVGASFTWELCCNWSMFVNYDAQINNQQIIELGSGGVAHLW